MTSDFASTSMPPVYSSGAFQLGPRAAGAAVVWEDWTGGKSAVRVWTAKGGARVLVQGASSAVDPDISDSRVTWLTSTGGGTVNGTYQNTTLVWAKRQLDPDQVDAQPGIPLPITLSPGNLMTSGKWVALRQATTSGANGILVVDVEAPANWRIPEPQGHFMTVMALTDTELLLADTQSPVQPAQYFDTLLRYDLGSIAAFATKIQ